MASPAPAQSGDQGGKAAGTSITVTRGDGTLNVSWPAVQDADSYNVNTSDDGKSSWVRAISGVTGTSATISNVSNSATYVVAVQPVSGGQLGKWTNSAPIGPAAPDSVTVTRGDGTLIVSWTAVNGAGSYNVNTSYDGKVSWVRAESGVAGTSATISNVSNSETYVVAVQPVFGGETAGWTNSAPAGPYTAPPPTPPPFNIAEAEVAEAEQEEGATPESDNDTDDDDLIEVTTLAQFMAMQWDLDGDGSPESNSSDYNTAFNSGVSGCSSTCAGYELSNDLDITANPANAGTNYLIDGTFNTTFDGNGNDITNSDNRPLFETIGSSGEIKHLNVENDHSTGAKAAILAHEVDGKVTNVNVTGKVHVTAQMTDDEGIGALVDILDAGTISGSGSYAEVYVEGPDVGSGQPG